MPRSSEIPRSQATLKTIQPEYNQQERECLLQVAHESIVSACEKTPLPEKTVSQHLLEPRGAFTTLYWRGKLRGCVGHPIAGLPLYRTVIETARAAAFEDPRFGPVTLEEARELQISLSVLSPLRQIAAEDIEVGQHGLLITYAGHRGLLLPQVVAEQGWDRITFLEHTCLKAGLPPNAWRKARSEAFTAEVFGDEAPDYRHSEGFR